MPPKPKPVPPLFVDERGQICDSEGRVWGHGYFPMLVSKATLKDNPMEPDAEAD